jgi:glycosyltransferase involved in cell wall biosynthesis
VSNQAPAGDLISIIIPCHNESTNITPLYQDLCAVIDRQPERFELLFVDDGSRDDTSDVVRRLAARDIRIRLIELARNFGKEVAITAGLHRAHGAAAITIDADLQHPPALIPELIGLWRDGHEVVIGIRRADGHYASWVKRAGSRVFYGLMNTISEIKLVPRATDYRLLDRSVIEAFMSFTERNRITRGLIDWLGFRRAYVEFTPAERHSGQAAYSFRKLFRLATTSVISMSFLPLKLAGYLGLIIMLTAGPLGVGIFIEKYLLGDPWQLHFSGPAILAVIILFLVGLILASLGLIALYIANIHTEVMNRPLYVMRPERSRRSRGSVFGLQPPAPQPATTTAPLPVSAITTPAAARDRPTFAARDQPTFGEIRGGGEVKER